MNEELTLFVFDEDGNPHPINDLDEWVDWCRNTDRVVAQQEIDEFRICTFFYGLSLAGEIFHPLLWMTMVFKDGEAQMADACGGNREQAEAMHEKMVAKLRILRNKRHQG